jgi:hypothetical protein
VNPHASVKLRTVGPWWPLDFAAIVPLIGGDTSTGVLVGQIATRKCVPRGSTAAGLAAGGAVIREWVRAGDLESRSAEKEEPKWRVFYDSIARLLSFVVF